MATTYDFTVSVSLVNITIQMIRQFFKKFMENSNIYSFQDAHSSNSFEGLDWNDICTHVGLDLDIDGSSDTNEWNEIENEVEVVSASKSEKDEKVESEDNNETERKGELRAKMKELRKILKKAREHLSGKKNEDDLYDMYKSYKYCARSVKKQFKNIIETGLLAKIFLM